MKPAEHLTASQIAVLYADKLVTDANVLGGRSFQMPYTISVLVDLPAFPDAHEPVPAETIAVDSISFDADGGGCFQGTVYGSDDVPNREDDGVREVSFEPFQTFRVRRTQ